MIDRKKMIAEKFIELVDIMAQVARSRWMSLGSETDP